MYNPCMIVHNIMTIPLPGLKKKAIVVRVYM